MAGAHRDAAEATENEVDEEFPPSEDPQLQTLFHVLPADVAAAASVSEGPGIRKRCT